MSSTHQGFLRKWRVPPNLFRRALNLWPPFRGAGIRVTRVSPDYREIDVKLRLGLLNRNYFGTHFGGSLYAMTDPFHALMMVRNLGTGYVVWDKAGAIDFVAPGREAVYAEFRLDETVLDEIRAATANGEKYLRWFDTEVKTAAGDVIARVRKQIYVRRKRPM